jgi:hypothetical protein
VERVAALGGGGTERGPLERGGVALRGVGVALRGIGVAPRGWDEEGIDALGGGGAGGRGTLEGTAMFGRLAIGLLKLGGGGGALP